MNPKKLFLRSWFYFRFGYSTYVSFPTSLIAYASSIYYLAIQNLPFLHNFFPHFYVFILFALVVLPPASAFFAWMHFKRVLSPFYKAELDIGVEANPYSMTITTPVNLALFKTVSDLAKQHGIDTWNLDKIISETEKKFGEP